MHRNSQENTCMVSFFSFYNIQIELLCFTVHYCFMWISNPFMFGLWIERCDCILWYGNGLISYFTFVESLSFSDHTPVYSIFMAEVEIVHQRKRDMGYFSSRIEVEKLLPHSES
ncbi:hypothetical protein BRADI_5g04854v3 [Brachypodium distachyon]|uniref:Inositol polyphosphate-related phosphatase domain-containing protein n=1 Tax=Brachypodium distachyon TaxID=15368 RepID=A0A0Q3I7H5_BRADI|nr:hypothetical protein BRADI_5g04854v3 [Brachypodium distachyon]KQJ82016.1 hypothetical protein BRADI_5g04854v3 [Brachypodium distachyon]